MSEPNIPQHLQLNRTRLWRLRNWANMVKRTLRHPIVLVGSAISKPENPEPRDWDLRVLMTEAEFVQRWMPGDQFKEEGRTGQWTEKRWQWGNYCVEIAKAASHELKLNVDFMVDPPAIWEPWLDRPRLQLDGLQLPEDNCWRPNDEICELIEDGEDAHPALRRIIEAISVMARHAIEIGGTGVTTTHRCKVCGQTSGRMLSALKHLVDCPLSS